MRYILVFLCGFFVVLPPLQAQSGWYPLQTGDYADIDFLDVHFTSENTGYVVGERATALRTTDGGLTWDRMPVPASGIGQGGLPYAFDLLNVTFTTDSIGFIFDYAPMDGGPWSYAYRTVDGGDRWVEHNTGRPYADMYFVSPQVGFLTANENQNSELYRRNFITKTTNGGYDWEWIYVNSSKDDLRKVRFRDENTGMAILSAFLFRTTNSGKSWDTIRPCASDCDDIFSLAHVAEIMWVLGTSNGIQRSTDDGLTWMKATLPPMLSEDTWIWDIAFSTDSIGYALAGSYILKTTDGGSSWVAQPTNANARMMAISTPSVNVGYAVGTKGTIIKTTNGGGSPLSVTDLSQSSRSGLSIMYNSVTGRAHCTFAATITPRTLLISDLLGRTMITQIIESGTNTLEFDTSTFSPGLYFCRIGNKTARLIVV